MNKKITLPDHTYTSEDLIAFIERCVAQTEAFPAVKENLSKAGHDKFIAQTWTIHDEISKKEQAKLEMTRDELKDICENIVNTLNDHEDLEILTLLKPDEAKKFLEQL